MNLTTNTIKSIIQHNLPVDMTYVKANPTRDANNRPSLRTMGISKDKYFSIELVGHPKDLKRLVFMSLYDSPEILGRNARAIVKVIEREIANWQDTWFMNTLATLEDRTEVSNGRVRLHRVKLEEGVSVVFVEVK